MSAINDIKTEFFKSKTGIAGITILIILVSISVIAVVTIPVETFKQWNNPSSWIDMPKTAVPSWINLFLFKKIPEHQLVDAQNTYSTKIEGTNIVSQQFDVAFDYDDFPNDFIYEFDIQYSGSPLMQLEVKRPDGIILQIIVTSIPPSDHLTTFSSRIFSTDETIKKTLFLQSQYFGFDLEGKSAEDIIFANQDTGEILKGKYSFLIRALNSEDITINESKLIIGGKAFGIMGTDELRRDLAIGLLWGTPLALFIGISVAIGSVAIGLIYGVYAGYKGRLTDETMMRFNDVIYALPALPFLIILVVTINNSIFVIIGFLMIFGWVGVAKVSRSMAIQIKTRGYVEASKIMGQRDSKIIFKHVLPQLLPYAFASIAISVPAAITTEAGLSFLGLGDPSFPTWSQILHDANAYGAAARGLWWWIMPPGVMIALTGLAFVFIGNAIDVIVNPRLRR